MRADRERRWWVLLLVWLGAALAGWAVALGLVWILWGWLGP